MIFDWVRGRGFRRVLHGGGGAFCRFIFGGGVFLFAAVCLGIRLAHFLGAAPVFEGADDGAPEAGGGAGGCCGDGLGGEFLADPEEFGGEGEHEFVGGEETADDEGGDEDEPGAVAEFDVEEVADGDAEHAAGAFTPGPGGAGHVEEAADGGDKEGDADDAERELRDRIALGPEDQRDAEKGDGDEDAGADALERRVGDGGADGAAPVVVGGLIEADAHVGRGSEGLKEIQARVKRR